MGLYFLIPLLPGLFAGYLFKTCADEIGYLAGIFAIVSLILSLILAPWQIQVVLLIVVLVAPKKLLQNESKLKVEHNREKPNSAKNDELVLSASNADKEIIRKYLGRSSQASDFINEVNQPDIAEETSQDLKSSDLKKETTISDSLNQASVDRYVPKNQAAKNNSTHEGDRIVLGRFFS